jgi:hypothetical protein
MHTILLNGSLSRDHYKTFTSNDVFLNYSSSMGATRGFEGITSSFAMTKFSLASTKTKTVVGTIWYLHSEGVDAFI